MAAGTQLSVEEYLATTFRPDCDYVDGVVEERNVGEFDHAWLQGKFVHLFMSTTRETDLLALIALRMRVKPATGRVPDVCVLRGKPNEQLNSNRGKRNS